MKLDHCKRKSKLSYPENVLAVISGPTNELVAMRPKLMSNDKGAKGLSIAYVPYSQLLSTTNWMKYVLWAIVCVKEPPKKNILFPVNPDTFYMFD